MNTVPVPLFFNPIAGRGRSGRNILQVVELLSSLGINAGLVRSESVGDLETKVLGAVSAGTK